MSNTPENPQQLPEVAVTPTTGDEIRSLSKKAATQIGRGVKKVVWHPEVGAVISAGFGLITVDKLDAVREELDQYPSYVEDLGEVEDRLSAAYYELEFIPEVKDDEGNIIGSSLPDGVEANNLVEEARDRLPEDSEIYSQLDGIARELPDQKLDPETVNSDGATFIQIQIFPSAKERIVELLNEIDTPEVQKQISRVDNLDSYESNWEIGRGFSWAGWATFSGITLHKWRVRLTNRNEKRPEKEFTPQVQS